MKKLLAAVVAAGLSFGAFAADWEYAEWLANGTGNWSSTTRWKDGKLPADTRNVKITGCDAFATDEDYDILPKLTRIRFSGKATLDLRFDEDHEDLSLWTVQNLAGKDFSRLIKSGTGTLSYDPDRDTSIAPDRLDVTNGVLLVKKAGKSTDGETHVFGAYSPGELVFSNDSSKTDFNISGLEGDGVVRKKGGRILYFNGGTPAKPYVFSGTLAGYVEPALNGGCQYFTGTNTADDLTVRFYGGTCGVASIGLKGQPSSLGSTSTYWFQGGDMGLTARLLYLGTQADETDKTMSLGDYSWNAVIDAGAYGGVTFSGKLSVSGKYWMPNLILDGSNTEACVVTGLATDHSSNTVHVVKTGTGTWRFAGTSRGLLGAIDVEKGTLEFESAAAKGTDCALGKSTHLAARTETVSAYKAEYAIPWSHVLGDGTTFGAEAEIPPALATFSYVGSAGGVGADRLIAVKGAARLRNDTANYFGWQGVQPLTGTTGEQKLVLDGEGTDSHLSDATNIADGATLTLVKTGSGTWTVGGNHAFSGGIEVRGGTLVLDNAYHWYRFTVQQVTKESYAQFGSFGLWDADNVRQNLNLVHNRDADGHTERLNPGETAMTSSTYNYSNGDTSRTLAKLFLDGAGLFSIGYGERPVLTKPASWVGFVMRLTNGAPEVVKYDLMSYGSGEAARAPTAWKLEGSSDGRIWDLLDHKESYPLTSQKAKCWYTSNKADSSTGFSFADKLPTSLATVPYVALSGGGVLRARKPVAVGDLRIDAKTGGALEGFAFGESGTLAVDFGADRPAGLKIPGAFTDCTGVENLDDWTLTLNGQSKPNWRIRATEDGITVIPPGVIIFVR